MKHLVTVLCLLSSISAFSQAQDKGKLSLNVGFDGGAHGTIAKAYYQGTQVDEDTSGAVTTLFRFDAQYQIMKWVSAGFFYRSGKYINDENASESDDNKVSDFSVGLRLYPINKDKFVLYFGAYYGTSKLYIKEVQSPFIGEYWWKGSNFSADLGFNWYFAKMVGLNFSLGYSGHFFDLKDFSINGTAQNLTDWKHTFDTKGAHVVLGIAVKLLGE